MSQFIDNPAFGHTKSVVAIGDNFYSRGLDKSGKQYRGVTNGWNTVWRERMGRSAHEDVSWYVVYGNHDLGQMDDCICGSAGDINNAPQHCSQIIGHKNQDPSKGGKNWYMPHLMYSVTKDGAVGPDGFTKLSNSNPINGDLAAMPEVELTALETNYADLGMICNDGDPKSGPNAWKTWCPPPVSCSTLLNSISKRQSAIDHMNTRIKQDPNKLRIVFNHYPAIMQDLQNEIDAPSQQEWFAGHTHMNVPMGQNKNGNNWMVGGSGGWGLEGGMDLSKAGFAAVFVMEKDGKRQLVTKLQNLKDNGKWQPPSASRAEELFV